MIVNIAQEYSNNLKRYDTFTNDEKEPPLNNPSIYFWSLYLNASILGYQGKVTEALSVVEEAIKIQLLALIYTC